MAAPKIKKKSSVPIKKKSAAGRGTAIPRQGTIPCLILLVIILAIIGFFFFAGFHITG